MSSADDVREMETAANKLAEMLVGSGADLKVKVGAIVRAIGGNLTENRAYEFLIGRARRVDAWEMNNAKRRIAEIERAERRQRENEYLDWLADDFGRIRASVPGLPRDVLDRVELAVRVARGGDSSVALQEATEDHDQSREWPGA